MAKKRVVRKTKRKKAANSRKRLTPRKDKRGIDAAQMPLDLSSNQIAPIAAAVEEVGGTTIGAYREPFSGQPVVCAALPIKAIEPTPFQRDLSPTHTKRLAAKIEESGSFLDPLIVVQSNEGQFWAPNGRHRLAAAKTIGLRCVTVLISSDQELAYKILALNTEKAHNLKDRSLEVIRMARQLAIDRPRTKESSFAVEFEAAELLTLGIIYEENKRFAGGAYSPFLKKVDRFSSKSLSASLTQREGFASRIFDIEVRVKEIIEELRDRGFQSPYLRNYVVARINPVRFHRAKKGDTKPPMAMSAALTRMTASAKKFDFKSVKPGDLALVAAVVSGDE